MLKESSEFLIQIAIFCNKIGFCPVNKSSEIGLQLKTDGLIDLHSTLSGNPETVNVVLTAKGLKAVAEITKPAESGIETFEVDTDVPIPPVKKRGGRSKDIYPWSTMKLNESFHVGKTEELPYPAKKMNSSVSSANKRFQGDRRFSVRTVDETDPKGPGVRVFRVE
jgi:hypothetical protein